LLGRAAGDRADLGIERSNRTDPLDRQPAVSHGHRAREKLPSQPGLIALSLF
jgi:hypothetical protein